MKVYELPSGLFEKEDAKYLGETDQKNRCWRTCKI